jgi:hypothetical protein
MEVARLSSRARRTMDFWWSVSPRGFRWSLASPVEFIGCNSYPMAAGIDTTTACWACEFGQTAVSKAIVIRRRTPPIGSI